MSQPSVIDVTPSLNSKRTLLPSCPLLFHVLCQVTQGHHFWDFQLWGKFSPYLPAVSSTHSQKRLNPVSTSFQPPLPTHPCNFGNTCPSGGCSSFLLTWSYNSCRDESVWWKSCSEPPAAQQINRETLSIHISSSQESWSEVLDPRLHRWSAPPFSEDSPPLCKSFTAPHRLFLSAQLCWAPSNCPAWGPSVFSSGWLPSHGSTSNSLPLVPDAPLASQVLFAYDTKSLPRLALGSGKEENRFSFLAEQPYVRFAPIKSLENDGPPVDQRFLTAAHPGFPWWRQLHSYAPRSSLIQGHLCHSRGINHCWHLVSTYYD